MLIEYTYDTVFSFDGPNLCFLGTPKDFEYLGLAIVELTTPGYLGNLVISDLPFVKFQDEKKNIAFCSKENAVSLGRITDDKVIFELDPRHWERIFIFFALMSWDQKTYYLNVDEDYLFDLRLEQEIHFICSSEFQ